MRIGRWLCSAALLCLAATAAGAALNRPATVSPGGLEAVEAAPTNCPTFSWSGVARARSYEIAVYELAEPASAAAPAGQRPALTVTVPGGALSWTPAADRCLTHATAYVWFVRTLGRDLSAGDWSEGGMFRTPPPAAADLEQEILRRVERYLAEARSEPFAASAPTARTTTDGAPTLGSEAAPAGRSGIRAAPGEAVALTAEQAAIPSTTGVGVLGISHGAENNSSGVTGVSSAATGDVSGVFGFSESSNGTGVKGISSPSSSAGGAVGVLGQDEAASGLSAGVVGLTENPDGYGGFFWNEAATGDRLALVVAEPVGDPPTSADVVFSVDVTGDVFADGSVSAASVAPESLALVPLASFGACTAAKEGTVYYDTTEKWLCICSNLEWRRADDATTCS